MAWWQFLIAFVWVVLFWLRLRRGKSDRNLAAVDGRMREHGRGGF